MTKGQFRVPAMVAVARVRHLHDHILKTKMEDGGGSTAEWFRKHLQAHVWTAAGMPSLGQEIQEDSMELLVGLLLSLTTPDKDTEAARAALERREREKQEKKEQKQRELAKKKQ